MTVAEAMPKKVIRLFRLIRGILIVGCCISLFLFVKKEKGIMEEYYKFRSYLEKMIEYEQILADAAASYENGDLAASERSYLQVLSESLSDEKPYLGLAEIYCDKRWYDKALEILMTYPEKAENSGISEKIEEIEELVRMLKQSQFVPVK